MSDEAIIRAAAAQVKAALNEAADWLDETAGGVTGDDWRVEPLAALEDLEAAALDRLTASTTSEAPVPGASGTAATLDALIGKLRTACGLQMANGFEYCCDTLGVSYAELVALCDAASGVSGGTPPPTEPEREPDADRWAAVVSSAAQATPGPWRYGYPDGSGRVEAHAYGGTIHGGDGGWVVGGGRGSWGSPLGVLREADAEFIVAAANWYWHSQFAASGGTPPPSEPPTDATTDGSDAEMSAQVGGGSLDGEAESGDGGYPAATYQEAVDVADETLDGTLPYEESWRTNAENVLALARSVGRLEEALRAERAVLRDLRERIAEERQRASDIANTNHSRWEDRSSGIVEGLLLALAVIDAALAGGTPPPGEQDEAEAGGRGFPASSGTAANEEPS